MRKPKAPTGSTGSTGPSFDKVWLCYGRLPSGEHTKSYGKWPFIVKFPIKNGDFPWQNVSSPGGMVYSTHSSKVMTWGL